MAIDNMNLVVQKIVFGILDNVFIEERETTLAMRPMDDQ
jgi:hypothetical protein